MKNEAKLQSLAQEARMHEGDAKAFMQPEPPKAKRGRPRKRDESGMNSDPKIASPPPPNMPPPIPTAKIVKPLVHVVSRLGEGYAGHPAAAMKPEELEAISESLGLVLDKWMPTIAGQFGAELMLGVALGQYGLRIMAVRKYVEDEEKKRKNQHAAQAGPTEQSRMSDPSGPSIEI